MNDENIRREVPVSVKATRTSKNPGISIRPITVDGLDMKNKIAYQFQGCYWHGCRKCHPENEMKYVRTSEQTEQLKEQGYKVVEMWECEWNKIKNNLPNKSNLEEQARHQHIDVRKAFFGGRTEGFKTYHKCNDKEKYFIMILLVCILQLMLLMIMLLVLIDMLIICKLMILLAVSFLV